MQYTKLLSQLINAMTDPPADSNAAEECIQYIDQSKDPRIQQLHCGQLTSIPMLYEIRLKILLMYKQLTCKNGLYHNRWCYHK